MLPVFHIRGRRELTRLARFYGLRIKLGTQSLFESTGQLPNGFIQEMESQAKSKVSSSSESTNVAPTKTKSRTAGVVGPGTSIISSGDVVAGVQLEVQVSLFVYAS